MTGQDDNVIELLRAQHAEIRRLAGIVADNTGAVRQDAFERLRALLAVHETAEEEIVHPFARRSAAGGEKIVEARLAEEHEAKVTLQELERLGPDAHQFDALFTQFRADVEEHAGREESEEFPRIAEEATPEQLRGMVAAVKAAEAVAPTHPHPGVESPLANAVLGPGAAIADRARDAIRKAR
ncbi:hemerythrin domain-containing protein [Actinomadura parmotrematis]|uniref:Hemerythrin domain-containing protein n=1 Tax=Actinomadura parmotrematis TaxID=2864039 RepID=A0ABS7FU71_9ACTN|nr:hemerythrin domain-containing protein [Actinomadura parmotrematis]MBW8483083.1 hemerythrin domain-containing protein [Actinomadura parmotrematis]